MNTINEIQALQNFADTLGLLVHQKCFDDRRRTTNKFFLVNKSGTSVSPVMDYKSLNSFMLGWHNAIKTVKP